ncbi:lipoate--protein ligase family protein [Actinomyces minihominis]|uniref:lipoate--protein ligase family protein n=1 Tax=Actinomyces minihominis TaxID=2002838 RepID=UPI000C08D228|nr:biotin/lipoate A/B protein ligase family protein [Actinomyces minihominis]
MHGEYKEPGAKLVVVDLEDEVGADGVAVVRNVKISGDFFAEPDDVIFRIQDALEGIPTSSTGSQIAALVEKTVSPGDVLFGVSPHGIGVAFRRALGAAIDWDDLDLEVIHGPSVSPVMNVALDETLVEDVAAGRRKPFMRIWEWDSPQIVIGSFQSFENEINSEGIEKHGITVSRRVSGGGAMFMEPGNCITYSLVVPTSLVDGMSFQDSYEFLDQWVMAALERVGVKAFYVPLNDIASSAGKIGGAAQKRWANGYMLHHVTMSYDIDAVKMMECLRIGKEKIRDKGLRSASKRVDPMRSQTGMEREAIIEVFIDQFKTLYQASDGELTADDLEKAEERVTEKFGTEEWIHRVP